MEAVTINLHRVCGRQHVKITREFRGAGEGIRTLDPNLGNRTRPLFRPHLILSQSPLKPSNNKAFLAALHALSILFIPRETPSAASPELPRHLPGSSGKQNADFRNESRAIAGSHRSTRGEQNGHNPRTFDPNISDRAKKSKFRNGLSLRWMSQPSFFCSSEVLRCLPKTSPCFPGSPQQPWGSTREANVEIAFQIQEVIDTWEN